MKCASWLSPPAVAELLGIDPSKVHSWIRSGELRAANAATRINGRPRWRIAPAELEAFLLRRQSPAAPVPRQKWQRPAQVIEFF
jgi:excisionase family DNA binding protein